MQASCKSEVVWNCEWNSSFQLARIKDAQSRYFIYFIASHEPRFGDIPTSFPAIVSSTCGPGPSPLLLASSILSPLLFPLPPLSLKPPHLILKSHLSPSTAQSQALAFY